MAAPLSEANLNDPVTRHLRRDFTQLFTGQTVGEALAAVRERPPEGRVIYFYVTDKDGRLQGVVPTRRLLLNSLDKPISEIMVREIIAIPATATVLDACEFFIQHRLLAFPVVDENRRIVGLVDVDLYTEELRDLERTERVNELFQLIGVHVTEAEQAQPFLAFRHRFPWLLCNLAGGILAAFLAHLYRAELAWQDAVLALFIPVVLALSESVSIQSVTLTLDTLHGRLPTWTMLARKIARETRTGALLGIACGVLVAALALIWLREPKVAMCLVVGIGGGVTVAAIIGMFLPNLLRLLRRNPQVAAGPIALAFADLITLLLYFRMAQWLLV
ncbi:MAG TPA: magnesium transporter [Gemmataceae bacterium]|nr:magnesium transporter [Gemmataceae bacterium]